MKRTLNAALVFLVLSLLNTIHPSTKLNGFVELSDQLHDSLEINGEATLTNVTVKNLLKMNGFAKLKDCTLHGVDINGDTTIIGGDIDGDLKTNGECLIKKVSLTGLCEMHGNIDMQESTLRKLCTVSGAMKAVSVKFESDLVARTKKLSLNNCTTHNIEVKKNTSKSRSSDLLPKLFEWFSRRFSSDTNETQTIELTDTTVHGNITFESGKGNVIFKGDSQVTGSIIGGKKD